MKKIDYASVYFDPTQPGSFGGAVALWKAVGGTLQQAQAWLDTQDTYALHKPVRKKFPRNRIVVAGIDDQWEADLIDMQSLASENGSKKYILTVIDALSKYAWALPLKDKTGATLVRAFSTIFKERQQGCSPVKYLTSRQCGRRYA